MTPRKTMLLTAVFLAATVAAPALADGFSFGFGYNSAPRYYAVPRTVVYSEPDVVYDAPVYYDSPRVAYFSTCAPAPVYYSSWGPSVVYRRPVVYDRPVVYGAYPRYVRSSGVYFHSYPATYRSFGGGVHFSYRGGDGHHDGGFRVRGHRR